MMNDSLKIHQNDDGSFSLEWDKELQVIIEQAIKDYECDK